MQVTLSAGKFIARSTFAEKDVVKAAGFRWDPSAKTWWTDSAERAAKLIAHADAAAREAIAAHVNAKAASVAASRAADADISIPVPAGLSYLPYQKAGVAYALGKPGVLIADEMGLGKTIQAIGIANATPGLSRVLIVCPASLKLNWAREWAKWSVSGLTVGVVRKAGEGLPDAGVVIVNYEIVGKLRAAIDAVRWDLLIVDEAHYLKNPKAQRTAAILGQKKPGEAVAGAIAAERRVFLTGTPIVNRPIEAWPLIASLDPTGLGKSFWGYANRFCAARQGRYGWDLSGASNLDELQAELRGRIMVRRLKADVLTELPPKTRQVVVLEADGADAKRAVAREQQAFVAYEQAVESLRAAVELAKAEGEDGYRATVEQLRDAASVAFTEVSLARHEVALRKVPTMVEAVLAAADSHPVVVMAHHKDVVEALRAALEAAEVPAVVVTGDVAVEARQEAVDAFQQGRAQVFIGTIRAAGVGLTLTRSSHVIFAELDWVPGNVSQAEDRCHRIGQRDNVLVQHYVLDGSLDARMARTLIAKQEVIDKALDRGGDVQAIDLAALPPLSAEEEPATADLTPAKVERAAVEIDPAVAAAAHEALRLLAATDTDRARIVNGVGFNKLDGRIGHELASRDRLTPRQAVLALRIARKYHRQLPADLKAAMGVSK